MRSFFGGVRMEDRKVRTREKAIEELCPKQVVLPLSGEKGQEGLSLVNVGDRVDLGQKIGASQDGASVVHATVSGTVKAVEPRLCAGGKKRLSIVIENDGEERWSSALLPPLDPETLDPETLIRRVREAGIVGMGGASFPTDRKLSGGLGKVRTVIVNGAECEPYLTCDERVMLERPEQVIGGAVILARLFRVDKVIIAVEENKSAGIKALRQEIQTQGAPVVVEVLRERYPQGGEKQLCQTLTGRQIPAGGLAVDLGCLVLNLSTVCAMDQAVRLGRPLLRRVVTVSGPGVQRPGNLDCPIGTLCSELLDHCGVREEMDRLVLGGPMMGRAQSSAEVPVEKGIGGVLAFCGIEPEPPAEPRCIRCGRCVSVCPMHLEPLFLYEDVQHRRTARLREGHLMDCIECGACAYRCPARLELVQMIRSGKQLLWKEQLVQERGRREVAQEPSRAQEKRTKRRRETR